MAARLLPVVYACSGSTSAGAVADHVARRLDRLGRAEMGSIAGVGAGEPMQLSRARSRFPVIAIDGCGNRCASRCLERNGVTVNRRIVLSQCGIERRNGADFRPEEATLAFETVGSALS